MVEAKSERQWKSEGFTDEEIRAYSVIGLVLASYDDADEKRARETLVKAMRASPIGTDRDHARYVEECAGATVSAVTAIKAMLMLQGYDD